MDTNDRTLESKSRTQGTTSVLKETEKLSVAPVMEREPSTTPVKSRLPENELQSGSVTLTGNETGEQPSEGETVTQELSIGAIAQEGKEAAAQTLSDPSPTISNTRETGVSSGNFVDGVMEAVPDTEKVSESACDARENRSTEKLVPDKRRYVSHKSMTDPLKMDMSNPVDMHLTSSQLSLQCIECHIIFSDHKSKERHLKLNHPAEYEHCILRNSLFACYVCDQHFTNSTELMAHQKAHVERKPFKCQICGQAFKKTSELTVHKKIHFGEDGYACTDCGKPCKTFTLLKYHRRTHTGERPYVCRECGKRFSMPKALQKHEMVHEQGGSEHITNRTATAKPYKKKINSTPTVKYPCSVCKATFKTTKTRLYHIKTQHNLLPSETSDALSVGQQVRQGTPTITPISICQSTLLQGEPIGPLQQVDANIDTEQIRKLIESLGNVQKVNQVVILGQVPQNALPLGLQQIPKLGESVNFNVNPSPIDMLKETEQSMTVETEYENNVCDPMEQTIILEPITPDGQLLNPPFSELSSYIVPADNIGLSLHPEQSETHEKEMIHQLLPQSETCTIQPGPINQSVFEGEVGELQNPDQTVILELTPALTPTEELEQTEPVPQTKISSSEEQTTDLEKTFGETVIDQQESSLMPTVHLEITHLQTEQQDLPTCAFIQTDTYTETLESQRDSQTNPKGKADSQMQTAILESVHSVLDSVSVEETCERSDQEQPKELLVDSRESQQNIDKMSTSEDSVAQEQTPSQLEIKHVQQASQSSVNVMSAQELVKIRKRKPAKIFIFEDPIEQLVAKIKKYDKHFDEKPAKRQRKKKSRLVVKFGPKNKDKKNTRTQPCQVNQEDLSVNRTSATILSEKKVAAKKTVTKTKMDKKANPVSPKIQTTASLEPQVQIHKEDSRKKKKKKQKVLDSVEQIQKQEAVSSPVVKKEKTKKRQPRRTTGKLTRKGRKKKLTNEQKRSAEASAVPVAVPAPQITEDCLLLLKGHKQPQLKVYKLDPSKAPGQTQDISPQESPNNDQSKDTATEYLDMLTPAIKKKGGRPKKNQKARSLLSSLSVPDPPPEPQPTKPKSTRKRKASWKVETEGVITSSSHSRRALECKECGETFSGVCALQQHKATMHIVESPGLTFTNGNIFEGVSNIDLCKTPKQTNNEIGVMTTVTEWDTEAEMGEMALDNRDCSVSFPALSPSPSLFVAGAESESAAHGENHENTPMGVARGPVEQTSHTITEVLSSNSDKMLIIQSHGDSPPQTNDHVAGPLASDGGPSIAQGSTDEDVKGDLLLEVDLITVGEPPVAQKDNPKNSLVGPSNLEGDGADTVVLADQIESAKTTERSTNSQTTSCFSQQCKVEEEEVLVQRKGEAVMAIGRSVVPGVRRRGARGRLKRCVVCPRSREAEEESGECQIVFEKPSESVDSEVCLGGGTIVPDDPDKPAAAVACDPPSSEHAPVECASDVAMEAPAPEPVEAQGGESSQSPDIVLERFLTFRQTKAGEEEQCQEGTRLSHNQGSNSIEVISRSVAEAEKIKVEENVSEPPPLNTNNESQHGMQIQARKQGVRTILVKQESSLILSESQATRDSRHIRWNVEEMDVENPPETGTTEGNKPAFSAQQCVFYPVKEEQRETFLGATQREKTLQAVGVSSDTNLMGSPSASGCQYEENPATEDYQEIRVTESMLSADISDQDSDQANAGEAREDTEHQELRDFLLRGSDEDSDVTVFCDPPPNSEAQAMVFFSENPSSPPQPNGVLHKEPIEYFSNYFGWDTWEEFSQFTNKMSILSEPVTAKEVAQYVGIHIAMGTLKFPSLKLYWQDLTKVPMIAEAMPLSRFFQLSGKLKLASPEKEPNTCRDDISEMDTEHAVATAPSTVSNGSNNGNNIILPQGNNGQSLGDKPDEQNTQTEPLWRVQRLLRRFQAGCLLLTCESDYGVDQYSFPLTAGHNNKHSLHCTTLIGLNGLILHLGLNSDLSDKEVAVERLVPKGSVAFLCKQELSTPAMLERLLEAGAHGAGRVGGARGQVGDEFVSADGQLKLRRSHCGFVLSTVGSGQRNTASLIDYLEKAQISARLRRDLHDLYRIPLTASSPAAWPQAVLWRLTDLALVNSWLQYRHDCGSRPEPLTLMAFRLEVAKALIFSSGSDTQDSRLPAQPQSVESQASSADTLQGGPLPDASIRYDGSGHWPEQPEHGEGGRCRFDGCERTSRVLCLKCCVFLCISRNHNCFLKFHNQGSS